MRAQMRLRESSLPTYSTHHAVERGSVNGVDLAVDENGLWVIYTTARDAGRIVISKVNKDTLQLEVYVTLTKWIICIDKTVLLQILLLVVSLFCTRHNGIIVYFFYI